MYAAAITAPGTANTMVKNDWQLHCMDQVDQNKVETNLDNFELTVLG